MSDQHSEENEPKLHPRFKNHVDVLKKHGYEYAGSGDMRGKNMDQHHAFERDTNTTGHVVYLNHENGGVSWTHLRDTTDRIHHGSTPDELDKHLKKIHRKDDPSQHSEQETNMSQEFKPTTDRQRALLEDLGRFTAKQKQLSTIQFSERDKDYFSTNIKTIIDRLQETVDKPIEYNAEKGVVQFKEGNSQHNEGEGKETHPHFVFDKSKTEYKHQPHHPEHGQYEGSYQTLAEAQHHARRNKNFHVVSHPKWD